MREFICFCDNSFFRLNNSNLPLLELDRYFIFLFVANEAIQSLELIIFGAICS